MKIAKTVSLMGLLLISQICFAAGNTKSQVVKKPLDLTLSPEFFKTLNVELVNKTDILSVFNQATITEPELAKALGEIEAAGFNLEAEQNRRFGPTINLSAGVSYVQVPLSGWREQIGISFDRSLWNVPQDKLIEKAAIDISRTEIESQIKVQTLIAGVVEAYFNVLKYQDLLALRNQVIVALEHHREVIKQQFEVGLVTEVDLDRVQSNLDAALAQKNTAEANLQNALDTLSNKWDIKVGQVSHLKSHIEFSQPQPTDPQKWKEIMAASSLIFARDNMLIQGIQLDIEKEKSELNTPKVNFSTGCSFQDVSYNVASGQNLSGCNVGLTLVQPLYNGGYTNSKTQSLGAKKGVAVNELDNDRRKSSVQIDNAFQQIKGILKNISQYEQSVSRAENVVTGLQEQYINGLSTSNDVLTAIQQTLVPFKESLLNAKYSYFTQEIQLKLAAGTLSVVDLLEINKMLE